MSSHSGMMGGGGNCICPKCEHLIPHQSGTPCKEERCPECGSSMLREGSYHHSKLVEKKNKSEIKKDI